MPEPVQYDMWDALAALGIACTTSMATLGGLIGIQKKNGVWVRTAHDKSRAEIRDLQNRCRDLENNLAHLKEKVEEQKEALEKAEKKQEALATLMFEKLDNMNETLVAIRIALGIAERK